METIPAFRGNKVPPSAIRHPTDNIVPVYTYHFTLQVLVGWTILEFQKEHVLYFRTYLVYTITSLLATVYTVSGSLL
jgi:hypothetical protein